MNCSESKPRLSKLLSPLWLRYAHNFSWLLAEKLWRGVIGVTVGFYVAQILAPEQYGALSFSIAFVVIAGAVTSLGMENILVKELSKYPEKRDELLGSAAILRLLALFPTILLTIPVLCFWTPALDNRLLIVIIGSGLLFQVFQIIESYYLAQVAGRIVALTQFCAFTLCAVGRLVGAYYRWELWTFAMWEGLFPLCCMVGYFINYRMRHLSFFKWHFDTVLARKLLKSAWPLWFSAVAGLLLFRNDQLLINWILGERATGTYVAATRLVELFYFIPQVAGPALLPLLVDAYHKRGECRKETTIFSSVMLIITIPLAALLSLTAPQLINLAYGSAYMEAAPVLILFAWNLVLTALNTVRSFCLIAEGKQHYLVIIMTIGVVVGVTANYWLGSRFNIIGFAIASLLTQSILLLVLPCFWPGLRQATLPILAGADFRKLLRR